MEMLVAVALVSILMLMFAQIFSLASGIMSQQRGIAANDQIERQLRTTFRDDLNHRTFINVTPYGSGATGLDTTITKRQGYFHISEGSVTDDSDDILQLTLERTANEDPFYGRAVEFTGFPIASHPNQPEFDDQVASLDNIGSSSFSEVVYYLRNGNLYRRLTLLRQPIISNNNDPTQDGDGSGGNILTSPYTGEFWKDFDYSAFYYDPMGTAAPTFIGAGARVNEEPTTITPVVTIGGVSNIPVCLGIPRFRWGFDVVTGQPRFKVSDGTNQFFIGRFTQQETSDGDFDYPGSNPVIANWMDPNTNVPAYDTTNGVIADLNGGTRISEDVLLRNVHSFDIKVWDPYVSLGKDNAPGIAGFDDNSNATVGPDGQPGVAGVDDDGINGVDDVGELKYLFPNSDDLNIDDNDERGWPDSDDGDWRDIGHTDPSNLGFYHLNSRANSVFGEYPSGAANGNCFDTWHPTTTAGWMPGPNAMAANPPPYQPVLPGSASGSGPQALRLIRIHIRYVDQKSDQMRDAIIIHSLKTE